MLLVQFMYELETGETKARRLFTESNVLCVVSCELMDCRFQTITQELVNNYRMDIALLFLQCLLILCCILFPIEKGQGALSIKVTRNPSPIPAIYHSHTTLSSTEENAHLCSGDIIVRLSSFRITHIPFIFIFDNYGESSTQARLSLSIPIHSNLFIT